MIFRKPPDRYTPPKPSPPAEDRSFRQTRRLLLPPPPPAPPRNAEPSALDRRPSIMIRDLLGPPRNRPTPDFGVRRVPVPPPLPPERRLDHVRREQRIRPNSPADLFSLPPDRGEATVPPRRLAFPQENGRDPSALTDAFARAAPGRLTRPTEPPQPAAEADTAAKPNRPEKPAEGGKLLNVPMICTVVDSAFALTFRTSRGLFGGRYKLDGIVKEVGAGEGASASLTVPVSSIDWSGIKCPHCGAACRPIRCGKCGRLACDGRVTSGTPLYFQCSPSCGGGGLAAGKLETVTGSESRGTAPSPSRALICAPAAPALPAQNVPRLPKPR